MKATTLIISTFITASAAQDPIDPDVSGSTSSDECTVADNTGCELDGSTNEYFTDLTYNEKSGKFSGTLTTNLCASHHYGVTEDGERSMYGHFSDCTEQTFPAPDYDEEGTAYAAPLRGRIALTKEGVNIYGPFDAGFFDGQVCDGGVCEGGTDVPICEESLEYLCGEAGSTIKYEMLLDTCAGHAQPYHFHGDPSCLYDDDKELGHSELLGFALDGYGIYGLNDVNGTAPTDLDACNGHYGWVPANEEYGVVESYVYHYHTTDYAPYTLGCFGPVDSVEECKKLYPETCDVASSFANVSTADGDVLYNLDCPCFDNDDLHYNINSAKHQSALHHVGDGTTVLIPNFVHELEEAFEESDASEDTIVFA